MVLAESKVAEQGTWDDLRSSSGYVSKLQVKESSAPSSHVAAAVKPAAVAGTTPPSEEALMDLTRKIGDISVYCTFSLTVGCCLTLTHPQGTISRVQAFRSYCCRYGLTR